MSIVVIEFVKPRVVDFLNICSWLTTVHNKWRCQLQKSAVRTVVGFVKPSCWYPECLFAVVSRFCLYSKWRFQRESQQWACSSQGLWSPGLLISWIFAALVSRFGYHTTKWRCRWRLNRWICWCWSLQLTVRWCHPSKTCEASFLMLSKQLLKPKLACWPFADVIISDCATLVKLFQAKVRPIEEERWIFCLNSTFYFLYSRLQPAVHPYR